MNDVSHNRHLLNDIRTGCPLNTSDICYCSADSFYKTSFLFLFSKHSEIGSVVSVTEHLQQVI